MLLLRLLRIKYVYHYIPQVTNPVLLTPRVDFILWVAITTFLCILGLVGCRPWRGAGNYLRVAALALIIVVSLGIGFEVLTNWFIVIYFVLFFHLTLGPSKGFDRRLATIIGAFGFVISWLFIEIGSVLILFSRMVKADPLSLDLERQIVGVSIDLMYALQGYSVQLLVLFGYLWIAIAVLLLLHRRKNFTLELFKNPSLGYAIFLSSVLLSALAIGVAYVGDQGLRGVDTKYYLDRLTSVGDVGTFFRLLPYDPRLIYVLLLRGLMMIGASPNLAINTGPLVLMGLNAFASYLLGTEITQDPVAGGLVAMFSALGMQTCTSLYAGLYANWLSLFLATLAFTIYIRASTKNQNLLFLLAWVFAVAFFLAHPWSGLILTATLVCTSLLDTTILRKRGASIFFTTLLFAVPMVIVLVALYFSGSYPDFFTWMMSLPISFRVQNTDTLLLNLAFTLNYMVGGFMSAPVFYLAGLVGFVGLYVSDKSSARLRILCTWSAATSIPLLFAEQWIEWRLIYLMPIQILAGLGVYYVSAILISSKTRACSRLVPILICVAAAAMLNYLMRNVSFIPTF